MIYPNFWEVTWAHNQILPNVLAWRSAPAMPCSEYPTE